MNHPLTHDNSPRSNTFRARAATITAATGAAFLLGGLIAPPAAADNEDTGGERCWDTHFLDDGHTDLFYFNHTNGVPFLAVKDDTVSPYEIRDPFEVEFHAKEESLTQMPDDPNVVPEQIAGQEVYHLPLTQEPGLLWPGWESQPLASMVEGANASDFTVDINITNVEGPGEIYKWSASSFDGVAPILEDGSFDLPGTIHQTQLAHVHAHWGFTEPGAYYLTVDGEISHGSDTWSVGPATYLFTAGDEVLNDESRFNCDGGGDGIPDDVEPDDEDNGDQNGNDDENGNGGGDQNGNGGQQNGGGDQNGNGGQHYGGGNQKGGQLAETGPSDTLVGLGASLLLLGAGAGVMMIARRRNAS